MTHEDYFQKVPDYALGILTGPDKGQLEHHLAECPTCREAITHERQMIRLLQATVHRASAPSPSHLRTLMPAIPQKQGRAWAMSGWQLQLAPLLLIMVIVLGGILMKLPADTETNPLMVATTNVVTATSTYTPTATAAQSSIQKPVAGPFFNDQEQQPEQAIFIRSSDQSRSLKTPAPEPTPGMVKQRISTN